MASSASTAGYKSSTLRLVCEQHPQVVVGQCTRDAKGGMKWQDWCALG